MFFFKKKKALGEIINKAEKYAKDTLHLIPTANDVFTKIGGQPKANSQFKWPSWQGKSLSFVMQINFSEVNLNGKIPNLPNSGLLYVFYVGDQSTWGLDQKDAGSWKILYAQEDDDLEIINFPSDLPKEEGFRYPEKKLCSKLIKTYPAWDNEEIGLSFKNDPDDIVDEYIEWRTVNYGNFSNHQIFGWPNAIQDPNMDLDCNLVTNGIYTDNGIGYNDPRAKEFKKTKNDWILLLQIDSDNDIGFMWGDVGMLYFWIKKQDLEKLNFDNVWMIFQCG